MTPEEKAAYREKVQRSFYVDQPVIEETITVTGATQPDVVQSTGTTTKKTKKTVE
jgi:hypothetical protein